MWDGIRVLPWDPRRLSRVMGIHSHNASRTRNSGSVQIRLVK